MQMASLVSFKQKNNIYADIDRFTLERIFNKSCDSLFVTDRDGKVILANTLACKLLRLPLKELVGSNIKELIGNGCYDRSTALEATATKQMVTGRVSTKSGINIMSASTPLLDEYGEVSIVITNSRTNELIEEYMASLEKERALANQYKNQVEYLRQRSCVKEIIADSPSMKLVMELADVVARADSTVLLLGESGTGKEVLAHYIHAKSSRSKEAFIPVDCASIPENLMESEFFGYEKGAFTGASAKGKPGLFELANKGILFLDEIAELPLTLQSKLLRILETYEVRRVGGTTVKKVDIRLICATDKDLKEMVHKGLFRSELYYRLNVIPIHIPPLRERREDIIALTNKFLYDFNKKYSKKMKLKKDMQDAILKHSWPGNVRELRNVVERQVITDGNCERLFLGTGVAAHDIRNLDEDEFMEGNKTLKEFLQYMEEEYIHKVIRKCQGKIGDASNKLGIHRSVLYRKMISYGINVKDKK